jgi:hypothetical protein
MECDLSSRWSENDSDLNLVYNFTDTRARENFTVNGVLIPNNTLITTPHLTGANLILNDTATREIYTVVNGKNNSASAKIMIYGERCIGFCFADINNNLTFNTTIRYWSDNSSWPNNTLPVDGDDVIIN